MLRKLLLLALTVGALGCVPSLAPTVDCPDALRDRPDVCGPGRPQLRLFLRIAAAARTGERAIVLLDHLAVARRHVLGP